MKKRDVMVVIGLSLLIWFLEQVFDIKLPHGFYQGAWSLVFLLFVVVPFGIEWLKGESHGCD